MNKGGQDDIMKIFGSMIVILFIVIFGFGVIIPTINNAFAPKNCPTCDCSAYQKNLSSCSVQLTNLTQQLNETPIKYIQNVTIKEVPQNEKAEALAVLLTPDKKRKDGITEDAKLFARSFLENARNLKKKETELVSF